MAVLALWLFRHPATVHDNGRIGVGSAMLIVSSSTLAQVIAKNPQPEQGLGRARVRWRGCGLARRHTPPGARPRQPGAARDLAAVVLVLSGFVLTKTPPTGCRSGCATSPVPLRRRPRRQEEAPAAAPRSKRGAKADQPAPDAVGDDLHGADLAAVGLEDSELPARGERQAWWRLGKGKRPDPAYDTPIIEATATGVVPAVPGSTSSFAEPEPAFAAAVAAPRARTAGGDRGATPSSSS